MNNLKQMGLAVHNYHDALCRFPPGYIAAGKFIDGETDTSPGWGWAAMILPQLEQSPLYAAGNFWLPVQAQANTTMTRTMLNVFLCPSDQLPSGTTFPVTDGLGDTVATVAPSSYAASTGSDAADVALGMNNDGSGNGVFFRNSPVRLSAITDGTSQTVLLLERAWGVTEGTWVGAPAGGVVLRGPFNPCPGSAYASYLAPCLVLAHCHLLNTNFDTDSGLDDPSSFHPGGANVLFADGSVHFLKNVLGDAGVNPDGSTRYTPSSLVQQALGTKSGGEVISSDSFLSRCASNAHTGATAHKVLPRARSCMGKAGQTDESKDGRNRPAAGGHAGRNSRPGFRLHPSRARAGPGGRPRGRFLGRGT